MCLCCWIYERPFAADLFSESTRVLWFSHAQFFSLLLSESNGAYIRGVKLFVSWRGGEGDREAHTYRHTEEEMSYHISRLSNARQVGNQTNRMKLGMTQSWETWEGRILHFWPYRSLNFYSINNIWGLTVFGKQIFGLTPTTGLSRWAIQCRKN